MKNTLIVLALFFDPWIGSFEGVFAAENDEPRFGTVVSTGALLTGAGLQDQDGFLWFGSQGSGLYRFDGQNLVSHQSGQGSISDDNVLSLYEDREGVLWIGTARGLTVYDKRTNKFQIYFHNASDPISISNDIFNVALHTILEDHAGNVWVGTREGLNRFDRKTGAFERFPHDRAHPGSLVNDSIFALCEDHHQVLWIGTEDGLYSLDQKQRLVTHFRHDPADPGSLGPGIVTTIVESSSGVLWIGTNQGLNRYDREGHRFLHYTKANGLLPNDFVFDIHEDAGGRLWIGHNFKGDGLTLFDPLKLTYQSFRPDSPPGKKLNTDSIAGIFVDRSGITWVININGTIESWDPHIPRITTYPHDPGNPATISDKMVNTSYVDRRGEVWFATPNGLNRLDRKTGTFTRYMHDPHNPKAIPGGFVCGPFEDSQGNFWVLSDRFLSLFDRDRGEAVASFETFISPITVIEDRRQPDLLWLCSWGEGLARFDKRTHVFTYYRHDPNKPDSPSNDLLAMIYQAPDGRIWLPTVGGGLDVFDPSTEKVVRRYRHDPNDPASIGSNTLTHVLVDSRGIMWVGSYGGGLNRFDPATERFVRYTTDTGFPSNAVTNILEDNSGNLWLGSKTGFIRFNPVTQATHVYTVDDGLAGNQFQEAALSKSSDGTIWVATITGASSFNPRDLVDNPYVPPIMITSLKQSGEPLNLGLAPEKVRSVTLDWRHNFLEFEFAALSYSRPQKNRFKYKMEGLDQDWFDSDTRRFGRYANLPDGVFSLRVIGSNNDGVWNEQGVTLQVRVEPPFWRTAWFRVLSALLVLGAGVSIIGARVRRVRRERQALERDVAERKRTEAILRESEGRFRSLVSNVPGAFYRAGFDGHRQMRFLSPGFLDLTGIAPEEFLGDPSRAFESLINPEDQPGVVTTITEAIKNRTSFAIEYRLCRPDSSERWIQDRGQGEYGPEGDLVSLDGALFDITERRALETQLLQSQKLESIGRLAGGIAHDLNSMLTVVIGHAELAGDEIEETSPLKESLRQIQEAGHRAARLTSQLLIFARRSVVVPKLVDLNELVLNLSKMLRRVIGSNIELVTLPAEQLWSVRADPNQIEQVLLNLTLNARDAMSEGGRLIIRTGNVGSDVPGTLTNLPQGEHVMIEVTDSGQGMTEEVRQKIFEPFFTTKEKGKGTGLGLSLCYGIVEQAHGRITAESTPGFGSTFRIFLPRAQGEVTEHPGEIPEKVFQGGHETILLVEDESLLREFAQEALEQFGYRVLPASDGEAALRLAEGREQSIDLLLADVVMPRMGGKELAREFKRRKYPAAILFMSGYDEEFLTTGDSLEASEELLPKPFTASELARHVRAALDQHDQTRTPDTPTFDETKGL